MGQIYEPFPPSRYSEHGLEYPYIAFLFLRKFLIRSLQMINWFLNSLKYNSNTDKCINCIFKLMNFHKWIDPCNRHPNQETTFPAPRPLPRQWPWRVIESDLLHLKVTWWNLSGGFPAFVSQHHVWKITHIFVYNCTLFILILVSFKFNNIDWATSLSLFPFIRWRRKWQPTPVFLPGESQGRRSLVGCRRWGRTESDTTEAT